MTDQTRQELSLDLTAQPYLSCKSSVSLSGRSAGLKTQTWKTPEGTVVPPCGEIKDNVRMYRSPNVHLNINDQTMKQDH